MKTIFIFIVSLLALSASAQQVTKVSLQASGLTCSMCSNAINKSLKSIDYVEKVTPNIETSTFVITFKPGSPVDFEQLKSKVEDAGFFVSKFVATLYFNDVAISKGQPFAVGNKTFRFVNAPQQKLNGEKEVRILNKGFVSPKEYKKNPVSATAKDYYASI